MNILLLGKTGQISSEIQKIMDVNAFDRNDLNFLDLKSCEKILESTNADLIINTVNVSPNESVDQIINFLLGNKYI